MKKNILKNNKNQGVALLFTIMAISVLFVIVFGTISISLNETNFSISTKKSDDAFFAADIGSECALYYDKDFYSTVGTPTFPASGSSGNSTMLCDSGNANNVPIHPSCNNGVCNFFVSYINNSQSCASVTVTKTLTGSDPANPVLDSNGNISYDTKIVSKGYNSGGGSDCTVSGTGYTERELELNY